MKKQFLIKKSDGRPYEVIDKSPKRGFLFVRPMAVMELSESIIATMKKNLSHTYGYNYTDNKGRIFNITPDETKDCIQVKEFVRDLLFRDSTDADFEVVPEPVVKLL